MRIINITEEEIAKMKVLKEDNVFLKDNFVYKRDSESEEIIKKIIELGNNPALDQLSKPLAILELQKQYPNVEYLCSDFKKNQGIDLSILMTTHYNMYRQDYCGCPFSR